jgi:predicted RNA-binding Zn ribbon-like protein
MGTNQLRRGGIETPDGFLFELTGGDPALDLANTIDRRGGPNPTDRLRTYPDLVNWSRQASIIDGSTAVRLLRRARRDPVKAADVLRRAIALREVLFTLFSAVARGEEAPAAPLARLEALNRVAWKHRALRPSTSGAAWTWTFGEDALDRLLWPVVLSATELLTSPTLARLRLCPGHICAWLFLDSSPRGNRRWCDMTLCGNRAKAKRHYDRTRARVD